MEGKAGDWTFIAGPSVRLARRDAGGTQVPALRVQANVHAKPKKAVTGGYSNHGILVALQKKGRIVRDNAQKNAIIAQLWKCMEGGPARVANRRAGLKQLGLPPAVGPGRQLAPVIKIQ